MSASAQATIDPVEKGVAHAWQICGGSVIQLIHANQHLR
jgi:hypothetical protein